MTTTESPLQLTQTFCNQLTHMPLNMAEAATATIVNFFLMFKAVQKDESLNIISHRFFAKVLEANETTTIFYAEEQQLNLKP